MKDKPYYPIVYMFVITAFFSSILIGLAQLTRHRVEANEQLGFPADKRDYGIGAQIIRDLGLKKLRILTNNPKKISRLELYGIEIMEQVSLQIPPNEVNRRYLETKKLKLGHVLD